MAESIEQGDLRGKRPIARVKLAQFSWASGATDAVSKDLPFTGMMRQFVTVVNDNTANRTATVAILDGDDYELYSLAAIPENATTVTTLSSSTEVCVPQGCTVKVTPSGDPGASGMTVDVTFMGYNP